MEIKHTETTATQECDLLIIGTSKDAHIDRVIKFIDKKIRAHRLDIDRFPTEISISIFIEKGEHTFAMIDKATGVCVNLKNSKAVWFRRIGMPIIDKSIVIPAHKTFALSEAEHLISCLPLFLEKAEWVSDFYATKSASIKPYQLRIAAETGLTIPSTLISNDPSAVLGKSKKWRRSIYKTLSTPNINYNNGRSIIYTRSLSPSDFDNIDAVRYCPCQFQPNIPKKFELRITYIGGKFFPVAIYSQEHKTSKVDWRAGMDLIEYKEHTIPNEVKDLIAQLMKRLGLRYGAIDMIVTPDERHVFLEVNPHGAWGWLEDETSLNISQEFGMYLTSICSPRDLADH